MIFRRGFLAGVIVVSLIVAAGHGTASGSTPSSNSGSKTLQLAEPFKDWQLDPATYAGGPDEDMLRAVYESLLAYKPGTFQLVGNVASSWKVSPDGLTYTFYLRPGQIFHDGDPITSAAAEFSFQREIHLGGAQSFQLAAVQSMATPNPLTFVVTLKHPDSAFLNDMAAGYGSGYVENPAPIEANLGTDDGQAYLMTHDAGSGPYKLVTYNAAGIVLKAFPGYPGPKPYFTTVDMRILTNVQTEILQFEQGAIDALTYGVPAQTTQQLQHNSNYQVKLYGALQQSTLMVNPSSKAFSTIATRAALLAAVNRPALIADAYRPAGTLAKSFYPFGVDIPNNSADPVMTKYNPSAFRKIAKSLGTITIGTFSGNTQDVLAAENLQVQLEALGASAQVQSDDEDTFYGLVGHPNNGPDMVVISLTADSASPYDWNGQIFEKSGFLNLAGVDVPQADALTNAGLSAVSQNASNEDFVKAGKLYQSEELPIADIGLTVLAQKSIHNVMTDISDPYGFDVQDATRGG